MPPKNTTAQLELFNQSALPEAVTLHADRPGFFSLLVKPVATTPRQTSYRLHQVLAALDPDIDSHMSQATFIRPNRRLVNLWHLPLCFVDLDTYRTAYGKLHEGGSGADSPRELAIMGYGASQNETESSICRTLVRRRHHSPLPSLVFSLQTQLPGFGRDSW